jgi:hypothetical protein
MGEAGKSVSRNNYFRRKEAQQKNPASNSRNDKTK